MAIQVQGRGAGHLFLPTYQAADGTKRTASVWWWKIGPRRVSTGCRNREDAERWRIARLAEMGRGSLVGLKARRVTFEDCLKMLRADQELRQRRAPMVLKHLTSFFGGWLAADIDLEAVQAYCVQRRRAAAAVATVNLELARLRRALRLAWLSGHLVRQPFVPLLPGAVVRQGFLEPEQVETILANMPRHYGPIIRFLRWTGWRESEALDLEWRRVDRNAKEIRLESSKNNQPRVIPYDYEPVQGILDGQWGARESAAGALTAFVFPDRSGCRKMTKPALQAAWSRARVKTPFPHALIHDMRRAFVRDMERAGVPRSVAMTITGHTSETVYRRYAIVAVRDQREGLAKLQRSSSVSPAKVAVIGSRK